MKIRMSNLPRRRSSIRAVLILLLFGLMTGGCASRAEERLTQSIRNVARLELAEAETEQTFLIRGKEWKDIKSIEEGIAGLGELLTPGERIGVYSFRSYAVAYIDLHELRDDEIRFERKTGRVRLTLPAVSVESIGRSSTLNVLHERVSGSKNPITPEEKRALQNRASSRFLAQLKPGEPLYEDLIRRAESKAAAFFDGLARTGGYAGADITFKEREEGTR